MKKIIISLLMLVPFVAKAQSNWELPQQKQTPTEAQQKKQRKAEKEAKKKEATKKSDGKTYTIKEADRPYLVGAVPEVDGKVVYALSTEIPGKSAKQIYDIIYAKLEKLAQDEHQTGKSRIAIVDRDNHNIVATFEEWLVFTDKILVLDRSKMSYIVNTSCKDGHLDLTIERLNYEYEVDRKTEFWNAEELITDKLMLSNNGTKLRKTNSKFRKKTVDRMKEVLASIQEVLH